MNLFRMLEQATTGFFAWSVKVFTTAYFLLTPSSAVGNDDIVFRPLPDLSILTEEWEPYQYTEGGMLKGYAVDLLLAILEEAGSEQTLEDVEVVPWARGYHRVKTQPNTVLFSTTRTPEREELFKWVGPILRNDTFFIGKKDRNFQIQTSADLHQYRFGVIIDDASELFAKRHRIPAVRTTRNSRADINLRMLNAGRIDFVVTGWKAFEIEALKTGVVAAEYERVFLADSSDLSFAFSISTPDWIVERFEIAYNAVVSTGKFDHLLNPGRLSDSTN